MNDESEPILPSKAESRKTPETSLPPSGSSRTLDSATSEGTLPPGSNPPAPNAEPDSPPQVALDRGDSMESRIREATLNGGLHELPPDFGDDGGDWISVTSPNLFTRLFIDSSLPNYITTEMIERNFHLLLSFWSEKVRLLQQSAAKPLIIKRYGGEVRSEYLVTGYTPRLQEAYDTLSSPGGVSSALLALREVHIKAFFSRVDEKLRDYLVDGVVQPEEARALFAFAEDSDVDAETLAEHLQLSFERLGLIPFDPPSGETLRARILSTSWGLPGRKPSPQERPRQSRAWKAVGLTAAAAIVLLVIVLAFLLPRLNSGKENTRKQIANLPSQTTQPHRPDTSQARAAAQEQSAEAIRKAKEQVLAEQKRLAQAAREKHLHACRSAVQGMQDVDRLFSTQGAAAARNHLESARVKCGQFPQELAALDAVGAKIDALKEAQTLAAMKAAQAATMWKDRVAEIDDYLSKNELVEAKEAATRLLAMDSVPPDVAESARKDLAEAKRRIKAVFSGVTPVVHSKKVHGGSQTMGGKGGRR